MKIFLICLWFTISLLTYMFFGNSFVRELIREHHPNKKMNLRAEIVLLFFCTFPVLHLIFFIAGVDCLNPERKTMYVEKCLNKVDKERL